MFSFFPQFTFSQWPLCVFYATVILFFYNAVLYLIFCFTLCNKHNSSVFLPHLPSLLQVKVTLTVKWPWELRCSRPERSTTPWTPSGTSTVSFTSKTSTRTSSASPSLKETSSHLTVSYLLVLVFFSHSLFAHTPSITPTDFSVNLHNWTWKI